MEAGNSLSVLGVKINNLTRQEILERINVFLDEDKFHQIATINPEFILTAQEDEEFKSIINNCDLGIADGFGIKCAFLRFGKNLKTRITGIDLISEILKIASEKRIKIFLVASNGGLSSWEETAAAIRKSYPELEIKGINLDRRKYHSGLDPEFHKILKRVQDDINIVFCNFGAPFQEKFLNNVKNGKVRIAMGVGGSFDFITKKIKRAPVFMRKIGLEWLWRFILEPQYRLKRVFKSVIIFSIRVLINK